MSTFEPGSCLMQASLAHPQSSAPANRWRLIAAALRRLAQRHAQWWRDRRDVQILLQLDDLQLRDMGLTRGQIESLVAERAGPRNPTHRLVSRVESGSFGRSAS